MNSKCQYLNINIRTVINQKIWSREYVYDIRILKETFKQNRWESQKAF